MMTEPKPCPYRSVELGRLFCSLATQEGERSTSRVYNETCAGCQMAKIKREHPCKNLDIGLNIAAHRDRSTIDDVLVACKAYRIILPEMLDDCTPECPAWSEDPEAKAMPDPMPEKPEAEGSEQ